MTAKRKGPVPTFRSDGRYVRFSWRYNAWQVMNKDGTWRNVRPFIAQCYVAAGMPVGVQPPAKQWEQLEMFV